MASAKPPSIAPGTRLMKLSVLRSPDGSSVMSLFSTVVSSEEVSVISKGASSCTSTVCWAVSSGSAGSISATCATLSSMPDRMVLPKPFAVTISV